MSAPHSKTWSLLMGLVRRSPTSLPQLMACCGPPTGLARYAPVAASLLICHVTLLADALSAMSSAQIVHAGFQASMQLCKQYLTYAVGCPLCTVKCRFDRTWIECATSLPIQILDMCKLTVSLTCASSSYCTVQDLQV